MATPAGAPIPPEFLTSILDQRSPSSGDRPYVTLTFAQSIDAKIAGVGGKQLILSGHESMVMTHWMRTMHDGILIGIGTALNDDPQFNTRHLPPLPQDVTDPKRHHLPRPIILDTHLRFSPTSKLAKNYASGHGRRPWIITAAPPKDALPNDDWAKRKAVLTEAGVTVLEVASVNGRLSISSILTKLREAGIMSLMVEGGARIINAFLSEAALSSRGGTSIVDTLIVTVAPVFVGSDGVGYGLGAAEQMPALRHLRTEVLGKDTVVALAVGS
ncbi:hypothetical protein PLICRDRAFT_102039 [Plicaturopsis crispa FD-325 SS-3]|nr:hypothetical protein PLICRDRAFT_102039 [Plicaturopsis crispa FD-325 SS-3]